MKRLGGWIRPLVTVVVTLAVIVSLAGTALAAGAPRYHPASQGGRSELVQAPGEWLPAIALLAVAVGTGLFILVVRLRQHGLGRKMASPVTDVTG
jgi:hypothetical protein